MVHLTLTGLSQDHTRLVLVSDAGVEFTLDVDARLRAALRGDVDRLGQLEITMESTLRPRDIQARIRAGATPEDVARTAQTTLERIMPFVGPVLAERAHIAQRAQTSSLRRRGEGAARTLGEAVGSHLARERVSIDDVEWDAWRREDGRWTLQATYATPSRTGTGSFAYDVRGNFVVAEDDDARWLIGEEIAAPAPHRDDLRQARRRKNSRLSVADALLDIPFDDDGHGAASAASDPPPALGDDAIALVDETSTGDPDPTPPTEPEEHDSAEHSASAISDAATTDAATDNATTETADDTVGPEESTLDLSDVAQQIREDPAPTATDVRLDPPPRADGAGAAQAAPAASGEAAPQEAGSDEEAPEQLAPPQPRRAPRKRRASVPSWDEIMFGGGNGEG